MSEQIKKVPAVALRGMTILPGMIAHFDVSRERSIHAVEQAMMDDEQIFLVTQMPKLGPKAFQQCAGFLRVPESKSVLDNTAVHPESYDAAKALLELTGHTLADVKNGAISDLPARLGAYGEEKAAEEIGVGVPTLRDIVSELMKPGRDVRDELPKPILRTDVLEMKDLKPGMVLTGTVRNVIDFGVFVDIGVHQDGLVHISQVCDKFIRHPSEAVSVGDVVKVVVLEVDEKKKRISLSMKQAK